MPCYEVAIEARKNDTAEKCIFSAWIRGENTPKAVEEALQKVAYEHPDFGMLRPVCVEEQKSVAACWQEELKVNDMRESKNHILPGGFAETQSADMLWAMEAVSAKMAAERGIKRVPLAVLSQSEVTRRMKSI